MKSKPEKASVLSNLPSIDDLLRSETGRRLASDTGAARLATLSRAVVDEMRDELKMTAPDGGRSNKTALLVDAETRLSDKWSQTVSTGLRRVINATGVIIHTNLGRAPLSAKAMEMLIEAAGYCNIEFDVLAGKRGRRGARAEALIRELSGAEDALVVNNCAAAALFVLSVFAAGREVIISRGELIEIGG